jgi:hypothetical protein
MKEDEGEDRKRRGASQWQVLKDHCGTRGRRLSERKENVVKIKEENFSGKEKQVSV